MGESADIIGPLRLWANAALIDDLHAITQSRPAIRMHGMLQYPFIVVDEEARRHEVLQSLFQQAEFKSTPNGVCGAAAQLSLIIDGRTVAHQIDLFWQAL